MNTMMYDGFLAEIEIDEDAGLLREIIVNARKPLEFNAQTIGLLRQAFEETIHSYRDRCRAAGNNNMQPTRSISKDQQIRIIRNAQFRGRSRPGGAPDYWTLQEANYGLLEGLYLASQSFQTLGDDGREGVKMACQTIILFFKRRWENPELVAPFGHLSKALSDIQSGRRPELLQSKREPQARSRSSLGHHYKMFAAALHEADVSLGTPVEESAREIAKMVGRWPALKKAKPDADTIKNWRSAERAKMREEKQFFDKIVKGILDQPTPKSAINRFLKDGPPAVPRPTLPKT